MSRLPGENEKKLLSPCYFKKAMGLLQSPPSVTLSPPKSLDGIHPNLVCVCVAHMNGVCNDTFFFALPPGALGRGRKVKYYYISLYFNYKVNFKDF